MEDFIFSFWFWLILLVVVGVLLYKFRPGFKAKADKYIDRDGDGKPLR